MSSLRNAIKRREHKERSQPQERKRLGLLEKHKDYVLRARDYNAKQKKLRSMQLKAAFRNPDEFYFRMKATQTEEGVHISDNNHAEKLTPEMIKSLKTQDLAYLQMKRSVDLRKAEKLTQGLHFIDAPKDNKHVVFVDTEEQVKNFDLAEHFDTLPELVDRSFNRIRKDTLAQASTSNLLPSPDQIKVVEKQRASMYRQLNERLGRASKLKRMSAHLDLDRKLQAKGKKRKIKDAVNGMPAVYKWKRQRQK